MIIPCPACGHRNEINPAKLLGEQAKGKRKQFSKAELQRRRERLAVVRAKRHKKTPENTVKNDSKK